ncbi:MULTISPECIES: A24 family peptidase [Vibrio]|uniref:Peptidase A24 n=2 Tax=Vibrio TaxID=662 RepID=A0A7X4LJU8_9VIBR|nr:MULTISPECIES: prepilin peptidase [Vibrio]MBF9002878.1 prepilin peptidase [Vibrio nitrifigilis]MZI92881.1 peptidase A24 [Vibrio eleionomae]
MDNQFILNSLIVPLSIVVFSDLFYRKIHNHLILLLLLIVIGNGALFFMGSGSYAQLNWQQASSQFGWSLIGALSVLVIGFALFSIGQMGAGDVKLMAVLCLLVGGENQVTFLLITALAGGFLAFMMPFVRVIEVLGAKRILQISALVPWLRIPIPESAYSKPTTAGLPYGLAISAGAVLSLTTPLTH